MSWGDWNDAQNSIDLFMVGLDMERNLKFELREDGQTWVLGRGNLTFRW